MDEHVPDPKLKLILVVYVDVFKMSGPQANLAEGSALISKFIKMEKPTPLGRYLGCNHVSFTADIPDGYNPAQITPSLADLVFPADTNGTAQVPGKSGASLQGGRVSARFLKYDMRDFLEQCVEKVSKVE